MNRIWGKSFADLLKRNDTISIPFKHIIRLGPRLYSLANNEYILYKEIFPWSCLFKNKFIIHILTLGY